MALDVLQEFIQLLVHRGVNRMAGAEQDGIEVLILLQVLLVEGQLSVAGVRRTESPYGGETLGTQVRPHMLDSP